MATRLADISLVPLSNLKFDSLRARGDVKQDPGATPELGDKYDEANLSKQAYTGRCERFDLSDEKQRKKYAEITAKLLSGAEYVKLWEERLPGSNGEYYVYLTYAQVMTIYQTGNDKFDLHEDVR